MKTMQWPLRLATAAACAWLCATAAVDAQPPFGAPGGPGRGGPPGERMFQRWDQDDDGKLTEGEVPSPMWDRLSRIDKDSDGSISRSELDKARRRRGRPGAMGPQKSVDYERPGRAGKKRAIDKEVTEKKRGKRRAGKSAARQATDGQRARRGPRRRAEGWKPGHSARNLPRGRMHRRRNLRRPGPGRPPWQSMAHQGRPFWGGQAIHFRGWMWRAPSAAGPGGMAMPYAARHRAGWSRAKRAQFLAPAGPKRWPGRGPGWQAGAQRGWGAFGPHGPRHSLGGPPPWTGPRWRARAMAWQHGWSSPPGPPRGKTLRGVGPAGPPANMPWKMAAMRRVHSGKPPIARGGPPWAGKPWAAQDGRKARRWPDQAGASGHRRADTPRRGPRAERPKGGRRGAWDRPKDRSDRPKRPNRPRPDSRPDNQ
jgi:hypothetical protein